MAKAAVKNLMFSNQEKEIKAVRSQQRSEGQPKGGQDRSGQPGTTAHGGTQPPRELISGPGRQEGQENPPRHQPNGDPGITTASSATCRLRGHGARGGRSTVAHQERGRQVTLHVHDGGSRTRCRAPTGPHRAQRSCALWPRAVAAAGAGPCRPGWLQRGMETGQTLLCQSL